MKLLEILNIIKVVAGMQPFVNQVIANDIYRLNALTNVKYGVFGYQQRQHQQEADGEFWRYTFQFFALDRLTQDGGNEEELQSTAIEVLDNIIKTLVEVFDGDLEIYGDVSFQPFTQQFKDETAGAYCTITFRLPADCLCPEIF